MSVTSSFISEEYSTKNDNVVATYLPLGEYPNYSLYYISTMFVNIQQVKTNLNAQHQHEKHELIQLNERLRFFIDRVQQLELQNAKYVAILANYGQQSSSIFVTEVDERYVHLQADFMAVNYKKIDYEFEFELFQMHSEIYKQLIHVINQSSDEQRLKLQQELDQSSSTLINLRTSYANTQKKIEILHAEREDTLQQYLKVTDNWGHCRKQIAELKISVQAVKNQHVFYKNVRSHVSR
jgi:chromosome segregation ATPase